MALSHPAAYNRLLEQLQRLPGVGRRSAERIAFHLLRSPEADTQELAEAIRGFRTDLRVCSITGIVSDTDPSAIATDPRRDHGTVMVVEQPSDVIPIEQSGAYRGSYHVLMGRLSPLDAIGPGDLNVEGLLTRIERGREEAETDWPSIAEVILATNPTLEGDGTASYLADALAQAGVRVSRLPRGLPANYALRDAPKGVLADAILGRIRMG
ncbi:MAG: recombination mediator RecR [Planctomycetota bacterium]